MKKPTPPIVESEKVDKSIVMVEEAQDVAAVAPEKGTTEKIDEVRIVEEAKKLNDQSENIAPPTVREEQSSNPTGQIRGVLVHLQRDQEEVSTLLRAPVQLDEECVLDAQLEE